MVRQERNRDNRAKRKLDLDDKGDEQPQNKRTTSANTAIEVTEYVTRQKASTGINPIEKSSKVVNKTSLKGNESRSDKSGSNNNAIPEIPQRGVNKCNKVTSRNSKATTNSSSKGTSSGRKTGQGHQPPVNPSTSGCDKQSELIEGDLNVYDGVDVAVNPGDDPFFDMEEEEQRIDAPRYGNEEPIPPEVIEQLKANPILKQYIGDVVKATLDSVKKSSGENAASAGNKTNTTTIAVTKSPSDTTIYRPAILHSMGQSNEAISKISNFVENIRLEASKPNTLEQRRITKPVMAAGPSGNQAPRFQPRIDHDRPKTPDDEEIGKAVGDKIVIDGEQLKAHLHAPKGKVIDFSKFIKAVDDDDEFFHVTCHINPTLRAKISKGEFVDLEQLLPKDKGGVFATSGGEDKVELVS